MKRNDLPGRFSKKTSGTIASRQQFKVKTEYLKKNYVVVSHLSFGWIPHSGLSRFLIFALNEYILQWIYSFSSAFRKGFWEKNLLKPNKPNKLNKKID